MFESYRSEFLMLALVHFLAVVVPGPDFAVTVRQSVRFGRTVGLVTAAGIGLGISLHVGYTLLGMGALLHTYPWLLQVVSVLGALYLIYLGSTLMRARPSGGAAPSNEASVAVDASAQAPSMARAFWMGFLTNAMNPKATLFFVAIFSSLVRASTPLSVQALYGLWMCGVNASWFMAVATLFTLPNIRQGFLHIGPWLERLMGGVLLAFALHLIVQNFWPA